MFFEEFRNIQDWAFQNVLMAQIECDEKSSNPAIAIKKWVDGLKLCVHESGFYKRSESIFFVQKAFPIREGSFHFLSRRRHKASGGRRSATEPILRNSDLSRRFPWRISSIFKQGFMYLANEAN